jgi:hypothetical protein
MRLRHRQNFLRVLVLCTTAALGVCLSHAQRAIAAAPAVASPIVTHFAIDDFDGDHRPDVASIDMGQSGARDTRYWVAFHLSAGTESMVAISAPSGGLDITSLDLNLDGFPDVLVTSAWTKRPVAVLLNDGFGNFTRSDVSPFQNIFAASDASWTSESEEIRDLTALPLYRSIAGNFRSASRSTSNPKMSRLLSPKASPAAIALVALPSIGRAPPLLQVTFLISNQKN